LPMTFKPSFLKTTAYTVAFLYLSGMFCFPLVPKAQALYWEDDQDEGNDPNETKARPDHFSLFDWVNDMDKDSKKKHYQQMDNHDKGASVNNADKAGVVILSGVVGAGTGVFVANRVSDSNNMTSNMFIGGAIGLGVGIAFGVAMMPHDYEMKNAQSEFLKQQQAWLEDPLKMELRKAAHPADLSVSFKF
jgi:hypothetical protein